MSNPYFKFKQFTIHQDKCSMKVCTDACLFGAWSAMQIQNEKFKSENILDIGAGTALLSLMLAQQIKAKIDAVEIDKQAASQTKENFTSSPWDDRLSIFNIAIQNFKTDKSYDVVISNPPFFQSSLKSEDKIKNLAKHSTELSFKDLNDIVVKLLKQGGKFFLLLPYYEFDKYEKQASEKGLYLTARTDVQQTPSHTIFRSMGIFTKEPLHKMKHDVITIKDMQNEYTPHFKELLCDYYLNL